jgi:prevent-host-death family protein
MPAHDKKAIRKIAISEFKAKCLSLLAEVNQTKTPLQVTRRGKPIVIPASSHEDGKAWIGEMAGSIEILGDIVSPVIDLGAIEALTD